MNDYLDQAVHAFNPVEPQHESAQMETDSAAPELAFAKRPTDSPASGPHPKVAKLGDGGTAPGAYVHTAASSAMTPFPDRMMQLAPATPHPPLLPPPARFKPPPPKPAAATDLHRSHKFSAPPPRTGKVIEALQLDAGRTSGGTGRLLALPAPALPLPDSPPPQGDSALAAKSPSAVTHAAEPAPPEHPPPAAAGTGYNPLTAIGASVSAVPKPTSPILTGPPRGRTDALMEDEPLRKYRPRMCAGPGCSFRVHSNMKKMGGWCCQRCCQINCYQSGQVVPEQPPHGPACERQHHLTTDEPPLFWEDSAPEWDGWVAEQERERENMIHPHPDLLFQSMRRIRNRFANHEKRDPSLW